MGKLWPKFTGPYKFLSYSDSYLTALIEDGQGNQWCISSAHLLPAIEGPCSPDLEVRKRPRANLVSAGTSFQPTVRSKVWVRLATTWYLLYPRLHFYSGCLSPTLL